MPGGNEASGRRGARLAREGARLHEAGDRAGAAARYRAALVEAPDDARALFGLGGLALEAGDAPLAIGLLGRATRSEPDNGQFHIVLGLALTLAGHLDAARAAFSLATLHAPDDSQAHAGLARSLASLGRRDEALAAFADALARAPSDPMIRNERGALLMALGRPGAAFDDFRAARVSAPADAVIAANEGAALQALGRDAEAEAALTAVLARAPDMADALSNRGLARLALADLPGALDDLARAHALAPGSAGAARNLAAGLFETDALDDAAAILDRLLAASPGDPASLLNRATIDLAGGRLAEGWHGYEARRALAPSRPDKGIPDWNGEALAGGRLLLEAEQGLGDTIFFLRYAALARDRAGVPVVLALPPPLHRIAADLDAAVVSSDAHPDGIATRLPLGSLPRLFSPDAARIPPPFSPAHAQPARDPLELPPGTLRVGIAWAGNPAYKQDRRRSIQTSLIASLGGIEGVALVSLQQDSRALPDGIEAAPFPLADLSDTASLIACLDLVVTVDTAIVHLAGGLGCPVWLLDRAGGDWRWGRGRIDTPWYPDLRIFRQARADHPSAAWPPVLAAVRARLQRAATLLRAGGGPGWRASSGEAGLSSRLSRRRESLRSLLIFRPNTSLT